MDYRPTIYLDPTDTDIRFIIQEAREMLRITGNHHEAGEMFRRATHADGFADAYDIVAEYVNIDYAEPEECPECGASGPLMYDEDLDEDVCADCYDANRP